MSESRIYNIEECPSPVKSMQINYKILKRSGCYIVFSTFISYIYYARLMYRKTHVFIIAMIMASGGIVAALPLTNKHLQRAV
jgi:hypothetical protein